jgi:hypothetical protein
MIKGEVIKGTLVLITPRTTSERERVEAVKAAREEHDGPVIVLSPGWKAMPADRLLEMLAGAEKPTARATDTEIGGTKPPPPPPPPVMAPPKPPAE